MLNLNSLKNFGLTEIEAKIYLELLNLGKSKIGLIIKRLDLHRGTVYNSLNKLIQKGFVSILNTQKETFYLPNKEIFEEVISEKKDLLKEMKVISTEVSKILKTPIRKIDTSNVKVLFGKQGFKSFYQDMINWCKKTRKKYFFMGRSQVGPKIGEHFYNKMEEFKRKFKIRDRAILSPVTKEMPMSKYTMEKLGLEEIHYIPGHITSVVSTWLYKDKVVIVLWQVKPVITIIIESKKAYNNYMVLFEELWKESLKK